MTLGDIFHPRAIKRNLAGLEKTAALKELVSALTEVHPELDSDTVLAAVEEREHKMNTGIGFGAAAPHGYYPGIDGIFGALGVSEQGVNYGAADNKPVHCIFLLVLGEDSREKHLRVLDRVMALIDYDALPLIRAAKTAEDIHRLLSHTGSSLGGI
ncbi:MAG: PTS sugar transporter subunit IIA [Spirochaetaceae bacterium]|jgi:mannitol/fructose-specific phosphotransferase system IIA component (Ntr-type)|nr:PTS sugar transporter subunit IIA [Spirochaetaceae bacterium]